MDGLKSKPALECKSRSSWEGGMLVSVWNQDVWLLGESKAVNCNQGSKTSSSQVVKRLIMNRDWSGSQQTETQEGWKLVEIQ